MPTNSSQVSHNVSRRLFFKGGVSALVMTGLAAGYRPAIAAPNDPFIEDLIAKMTLEEKAGQLSIFSDETRPETPSVNPKGLEQTRTQVFDAVAKGKMMGIFNGIGVKGGRILQDIAMKKSRLKIPLIFAGDVIHGLKTVFPIPLGEAASFDTDLAFRTARATAVEATARGFHWTFAPMVDIGRDQRWGRVAEGAGEDPYLGSKLAEARVKGFQGNSLKDQTSMLACPKHFAAYGGAESGRDYNTVDIPDTTLRQVYLPPFKAAFDAGALTTMCSFNDIAGVPATGNHYLLSDILRGEWGFKGLVVSDYTGDAEMIPHGYAADEREATKIAINAGCDVSMMSHFYNRHLPDLVKSGEVSMAVIDEAVRRVLRVKKAIGLFDNPYKCLDFKREKTDIRMPATVALSREAGRKSIVMLKNEGNILPLKKSGQSIALIGPFASDFEHIMGAWSVFPDRANGVSIEMGLRAAMADPKGLSVTKGSEIEAPLAGGIEAAVEAAKKADVVILAIGEGENMSGEAQSRTDIIVPAPQQALAEAVAATGKPVVIILRHGRALALSGAVRNASAILASWFLGSETGNSLADIIFGDFSPTGRLPVSFPQLSGQQPFYYNRRTTGRPQVDPKAPEYKSRYREVADAPLYAFGHGLTYSTLSYSATELDSKDLKWGETLKVSATITNTGTRAVDELAQLYIHDRVASITQPIRLLKGFQRIHLEPGQSQRVTFKLGLEDLAFVNRDSIWRAEVGAFDVWVSPSATTGTSAQFRLVKA